jgi:hypothetical protein
MTPRRLQRFRIAPHEAVAWSFGTQRGIAVANADGELTLPALEVDATWRTLELTRTWRIAP